MNDSIKSLINILTILVVTSSIIAPDGFDVLSTDTNRILMFLIATLYIYTSLNERKIKQVTILALLIIATYTLKITLDSTQNNSIHIYFKIITCLILFIVTNSIFKIRTNQNAFYFSAYFFCLILIMGTLFFSEPMSEFSDRSQIMIRNKSGDLININHFAYILAISNSIINSRFNEFNSKIKFLLVLFNIITFYTAWQMGTRGAMLTIIISIFIEILNIRIIKSPVVFVSLLITATLVSMTPAVTILFEHGQNLFEIRKDDGLSGRDAIASISQKLYYDNLFFGYGIDYPKIIGGGAHNFFLHIGLHIGLIGITFVLYFLCRIFIVSTEKNKLRLAGKSDQFILIIFTIAMTGQVDDIILFWISLAWFSHEKNFYRFYAPQPIYKTPEILTLPKVKSLP